MTEDLSGASDIPFSSHQGRILAMCSLRILVEVRILEEEWKVLKSSAYEEVVVSGWIGISAMKKLKRMGEITEP